MQKILGIKKPKGPTSHDIVETVRTITGIKKVGHAGTLDPLAEGVLVVGIGREATKQLSRVVKKEKEYVAEITLGAESDTDDDEGEKTAIDTPHPPTREAVEAVAKRFIGTIEQVPPRYSAVKIKGQEAYKRVRKGETFTMRPRKVYIDIIDVIDYAWPCLVIRVVTGPGVYIRSLARDIGRELDTGGYLSALTRTGVGEYTLENSITLEELKAMAHKKPFRS